MQHTSSIYGLTLFLLTLFGVNENITGQVSDQLHNGDWYKIEIPSTGVYSISKEWLEDQLDVSIPSADISSIQVYGIPGGTLASSSLYEETERLLPISTLIDDGGDGTFDDRSDRIVFYVSGVDEISYNSDIRRDELAKNVYTSTNFVFLQFGDNSVLNRVTLEETTTEPDAIIDQYQYSGFLHEDQVNLLDDFISTQGSGQKWYGQELSNTGSFSFSAKGLVPPNGLSDVTVVARLAGRSSEREEITLRIGPEEENRTFTAVNTTNIEALYARDVTMEKDIRGISSNDEIFIDFQKRDGDARLWLDELSVHGSAPIEYTSETLEFNNIFALNSRSDIGLSIASSSDLTIWNISDERNIRSITPLVVNDQLIINTKSDEVERFVAFRDSDLREPESAISAEFRDVIEEGKVDLLIITPPLLTSVATQLQEHRVRYSGLSSLIISPDEIYDVYSAGRQDPSAIRNYIRDLYRTHASFRYVLLLGDGSYDFRHLNQNYPDENLVPTYETVNSLDPLLAFPSDDFYAFLDDGEGSSLRGDLDIAVGRIPVNTVNEGQEIINKIISYDLSKSTSTDGLWKTRVVFLADDEDNNIHINDADQIAEEMAVSFPVANQEKIYFDAFRQESTPGGNRYPEATDRLTSLVEEGALVVNYLGHGGPNGWGQERVLKIDDINGLSNFDRLPLVITATCSFTGFDDPSRTTAGEATLLNPLGGAVALFTTVRSVFASQNFRLTRQVFNNMWTKEGGEFLSIGEIMRRSKNDNPNDATNARKFFLIGDPTLRLTIPNLDIRTDRINGVTLTENDDPIRVSALDQVSIESSVVDNTGNVITAYNGLADIIIYDKPQSLQTLANDARSFVKSYRSQQNIIYQGRAEVVDGRINTTITIPIDIDYNIGASKISYYTTSDNLPEAIGFTEELLVGGASTAPIIDDMPPSINVFLNNRLWTEDQEVPAINTAIIDLSDDFGINLSTSAIGHEITAVIDGDTRTTQILSSLYQANTLDPTSGSIIVDLEELAPGRHTLEVTAFDIANNEASEVISFLVDEDFERSISNITITPNPLSSEGNFLIETDLPDELVRVEIETFDDLGRRISQTTMTQMSSNGEIVGQLEELINGTGVYVIYFTLSSQSLGDRVISRVEKVLSLK